MTFVTLNRFCLLSNLPAPCPLFLMDNIKLDRIPTEIASYLFYIVFQILKVILKKVFKVRPPDLLFLFVFISFFISRYHFSQIFRTSFKNIWKKIFLSNIFFLFNGFAKTPCPTPLTAKICQVWQMFFVSASMLP